MKTALIISAIVLTPVMLFLAYSIVRGFFDRDYREHISEVAYQKKMRKLRNRRTPLFTDKAFRKFCRTGDLRYLHKDGFRDI